ncbi:toxin ParE1/3/4 [Anaerovibrio lipolyticus DSM 3074]|uniref:Addiction module toxin RelE n=2 Tax=Anaerovibrio lipolyticus TaxID=82374 RepID=A0A0B2K2B7_9FIRM|nr:type II toxin-antitoxin system RelE/ParE family toxin [Anaerovibrio lipolyticus]KHM52257.1 addiction module toxin RelE [Anaerovibrio lipolyticus]SHI88231.1 toxin ParE1/3/4 [Anaerovibrio lipolyticus DSM 3074]
MSYYIDYSSEARQDIYDIYQYIADQLKSPSVAAELVNSIIDEVEKLDEMPFRHQLYKDEPWHSKGLRYICVNNYLIFYLPNKEDSTVYVVRIIYGGRDLGKQLKTIV